MALLGDPGCSCTWCDLRLPLQLLLVMYELTRQVVHLNTLVLKELHWEMSDTRGRVSIRSR
jgi:hypothetical protein